MNRTDDGTRLTPEELARRLQLNVGTLANWRSQGRGPAWLKLEGDSIRYRLCDVMDWEESSWQRE